MEDGRSGVNSRSECLQRCYYELDRLRIRRTRLGWFAHSLIGAEKWRLYTLTSNDMRLLEQRLKSCRTPAEAADLLLGYHKDSLLDELANSGVPLLKGI